MPGPAVLFVGNLPTVANAQYVERLFSAYGRVLQVKVLQEGTTPYAEVTYGAVDDADSAISALHTLYCASPGLPLVVLYHRNSPAVSAYGRRVGGEYAAAVRSCRDPAHVPLEAFDERFERTEVPPPPSDKEILEGNRWNSH
ncbi:putative RNA-binding protein [Trypanosoma theileri]|uniref:Putative RNA-binding protein n=1 Tax=Trypanosoma theileri TaxID=67003 RepID=A0A1X0P2H6_9TRYP|nr:putative RNA-binding protein [Trypanosoma theileri]ORC90739.1 putative RNA-binding protein [Trypanosoma theileri]